MQRGRAIALSIATFGVLCTSSSLHSQDMLPLLTKLNLELDILHHLPSLIPTAPQAPTPAPSPKMPKISQQLTDEQCAQLIKKYACSERHDIHPTTLSEWFWTYAPWEVNAKQLKILEDDHAYSPPRIDLTKVKEYWSQAALTQQKPFPSAAIDTLLIDAGASMYRLLVPPDAHIIFFGDIHGNIQALLFALCHLKNSGVLNDTLKIVRPHTYLVFGGDFVDRGNFGVEVTTLLAQLYLANPENVQLLRGNHEDYFQISTEKTRTKNQDEDFYTQLKRYTSPGTSPDEWESQTTNLLIKDFCPFIHTMPSVLYVGASTVKADQRQYLQCCHGGLEVAVDPTPLLRADGNIPVAVINYQHEYSRADILATGPALSRMKKMLEAQDKIFHAHKPLQSNFSTLLERSLYNHFGYRWSDFMTPGHIISINYGNLSLFAQHRGLMYGSNLMDTLPEIQEVEGKRCLLAIFRAHQHNPTMHPLTKPIDSEKLNYGLFVLYKNRPVGDRQQANFPIPIVTTVTSAAVETGTPCCAQFDLMTQTLHHMYMPNYYTTWIVWGSGKIQKERAGLLRHAWSGVDTGAWNTKSNNIYLWENAWENGEA